MHLSHNIYAAHITILACKYNYFDQDNSRHDEPLLDTYIGLLQSIYMQAIGAGGQGWANAILYIFLCPTLRNRVLIAPCKKLLRSPAKDPAACCARSSTHVSQHEAISYGTSVSTVSIQNLF